MDIEEKNTMDYLQLSEKDRILASIIDNIRKRAKATEATEPEVVRFIEDAKNIYEQIFYTLNKDELNTTYLWDYTYLSSKQIIDDSIKDISKEYYENKFMQHELIDTILTQALVKNEIQNFKYKKEFLNEIMNYSDIRKSITILLALSQIALLYFLFINDKYLFISASIFISTLYITNTIKSLLTRSNENPLLELLAIENHLRAHNFDPTAILDMCSNARSKGVVFHKIFYKILRRNEYIKSREIIENHIK